MVFSTRLLTNRFFFLELELTFVLEEDTLARVKTAIFTMSFDLRQILRKLETSLLLQTDLEFFVNKVKALNQINQVCRP